MRESSLRALAFPLTAIGVAVAVRLALALGTDLYFDEAYYWTWSKRLDWSYFDHPPLTAWLMALFGARPTAVLLGLLNVAAVWLFAADYHSDRAAGARAAALWCAVPAAALAGVIATPDSPFLLFWTLSLWALHKERWLLAGLACGLAALSKYPAVLLGATWLVWAARTRRFPRGIWLTLAVGAALFLPVVVWNVQHDWAAFGFQVKHGLGGRGGGLKGFGEFLGAQFAMGGPVLLPLAVWWTVRGDRKDFLLRAAAAAPLLFFGLSALRSRGEANWAGAAYVAACVGLANLPVRRFRAIVLSGIAICLFAASHLLFPIIQPKRDVALSRLQGWSELEALRGEDVQAIFAPTYQLASQAAFYTGLPTGTAGPGRRSQYDLWGPPPVARGANALWIAEGDRPPPAELAAQFGLVRGPRMMPAHYRGRLVHDFRVWRLVGRDARVTTTAPQQVLDPAQLQEMRDKVLRLIREQAAEK